MVAYIIFHVVHSLLVIDRCSVDVVLSRLAFFHFLLHLCFFWFYIEQ